MVLFHRAIDSPTSVSQIADALPAGTTIAAFGDPTYPTSWPRPDAVPANAVVIEAAPEGLMVQTTGDSFELALSNTPTRPGWRGIDTFTELREALA